MASSNTTQDIIKKTYRVYSLKIKEQYMNTSGILEVAKSLLLINELQRAFQFYENFNDDCVFSTLFFKFIITNKSNYKIITLNCLNETHIKVDSRRSYHHPLVKLYDCLEKLNSHNIIQCNDNLLLIKPSKNILDEFYNIVNYTYLNDIKIKEMVEEQKELFKFVSLKPRQIKDPNDSNKFINNPQYSLNPEGNIPRLLIKKGDKYDQLKQTISDIKNKLNTFTNYFVTMNENELSDELSNNVIVDIIKGIIGGIITVLISVAIAMYFLFTKQSNSNDKLESTI